MRQFLSEKKIFLLSSWRRNEISFYLKFEANETDIDFKGLEGEELAYLPKL